jgi:hypothetical protein
MLAMWLVWKMPVASQTPPLQMGSKMDSLEFKAELEMKLLQSICERIRAWYSQNVILSLFHDDPDKTFMMLRVLLHLCKSCHRWRVPKTAKVKVKLSLCLTKHHTMKTYWGMEV